MREPAVSLITIPYSDCSGAGYLSSPPRQRGPQARRKQQDHTTAQLHPQGQQQQQGHWPNVPYTRTCSTRPAVPSIVGDKYPPAPLDAPVCDPKAAIHLTNARTLAFERSSKLAPMTPLYVLDSLLTSQSAFLPRTKASWIRVLAFLRQCGARTLRFAPNAQRRLDVYVDSNWASRFSVSGCLVFYHGCLIHAAEVWLRGPKLVAGRSRNR